MESLSPERQFSRAGKTYESTARIQRIVADELVKRIGFPKTALEIGAGTGLVTLRLSAKCPQTKITALDISPGMLEVLRRRMMLNENVRTLCEDFQQLRTDKKFDLIVSGSCLQWVPSLSGAFTRMHGMLNEGGSFIAGIMTKGTLRELRELREELFPALRPKRELPEREHISAELSRARFRILEMTERSYEDTAPSAWTLFENLKGAGLTGGDLCVGKRTLARSELRRLAEHYDARFRTTGGEVFSTYRVLYVEAKK